MPTRIDIEDNGTHHMIDFQLTRVRQEGLLIKGRDQAVNVVAVRDITRLKLDKNGDPEFDENLICDLTAALAHPVDMTKLTWEFFGGLLEVTVPKVQ